MSLNPAKLVAVLAMLAVLASSLVTADSSVTAYSRLEALGKVHLRTRRDDEDEEEEEEVAAGAAAPGTPWYQNPIYVGGFDKDAVDKDGNVVGANVVGQYEGIFNVPGCAKYQCTCKKPIMQPIEDAEGKLVQSPASYLSISPTVSLADYNAYFIAIKATKEDGTPCVPIAESVNWQGCAYPPQADNGKCLTTKAQGLDFDWVNAAGVPMFCNYKSNGCDCSDPVAFSAQIKGLGSTCGKDKQCRVSDYLSQNWIFKTSAAVKPPAEEDEVGDNPLLAATLPGAWNKRNFAAGVRAIGTDNAQKCMACVNGFYLASGRCFRATGDTSALNIIIFGGIIMTAALVGIWSMLHSIGAPNFMESLFAAFQSGADMKKSK